MELRHLRYFITLAEELHFGNAAKRLFIAQPPLSRQIKDLELELGVQLFDRAHKRVTLTAAGRYFLKEARLLVQQLEAAMKQVSKIHHSLAGELHIGYVSSFSKKVLGQLTVLLQAQYPYLQTKIFEASTERQLRALEQGKLDIGLIRSPNLSPSIQTDCLYTDGFTLVSAKKAELRLTPTQLSRTPFITYHPDYVPVYHQKLLAYAAQLGFSPQLSHSCNNIPSILELVELGLGISILPKSVAAQYGHLALAFWDPVEQSAVQTEVLLAYPKQRRHPGLDFIKAELHKLLAANK